MASAESQHDPEISILFQTSLGPTKSLSKHKSVARKSTNGKFSKTTSQHLEVNGSKENVVFLGEEEPQDVVLAPSPASPKPEIPRRQTRKRKRDDHASSLEEQHLLRLERDHATQHQSQSLRFPGPNGNAGNAWVSVTGSEVDSPNQASHALKAQQQVRSSRKSTAGADTNANAIEDSKENELEKSYRTAFLGNVSITAVTSKTAKRILLKHLVSATSGSAANDSENTVESLRFRSTPYNDTRLPRKAAYVKGALMDSTAKSTHAYAIYTTVRAAENAVRNLNGSLVLDRHLRVDSISHPAEHDHRRCIFVGNLGFVDDESAAKPSQDMPEEGRVPKSKPSADYEEGLWRVFERVGQVESVRIVRDKTTQVSKGFAYVQFKDANAVEKALLYHDKKIPPMLPRKLRVVRAKRQKDGFKENAQSTTKSEQCKFKHGSKIGTTSAHAPNPLGRAALAHSKRISTGKKTSSLVFEGHRATSRMDVKGKKGRVKPKTRSSRRGADFKRRKQAEHA